MNYVCENCGCSHDGTYGSGRFCSVKCARSHATKFVSDDARYRVSEALKHQWDISGKRRYSTEIRYCSKCGKQLDHRNVTGLCAVHNMERLHANHAIKCKTIEYRNAMRNIQSSLVATGKHHGWNSRNIKSYAERFFESVLDNNRIQYIREKKIGKYFLDFAIGRIDLEIDGKQHEYSERKQSDIERDRFLRAAGYFVYRIKWNEINSETGKEMMKDKIELLIDFIDHFGIEHPVGV